MNTYDVKGGFTVCTKTTSLEHLKKFWTKSLLMLNKLERQWQLSINDKQIFNNYWNMTKLKALFSCYELIIIQFNEYCEVLELQGLGKCMLKIFIQLMSILESLFKCDFYFEQRNIGKLKASDNELKSTKKTIVLDKENQTKRNNKKGAIGHEKEYFVQKQRNKFEVRQMEEDLERFQQKYHPRQASNDVFVFEDTRIKLARQKALDLQPSNAQFLITQACSLIETKYTSLLDLIDLRNNKIKIEEPKDYKKVSQALFEQFQIESTEAYGNAMKKLLQIAQKYFNARQMERRSKLQDFSTQTVNVQPQPSPQPHLTKAEREKQMKKEEQLKNLRQELKQEKYKNEALQKILREKTQQFEKQLMKQRATVSKYQQRISIATKFTRRQSQFTLDFVNSEQSVIKQTSQKSIKSDQKNQEPPPPVFRKKSFDHRRQSRMRPSYERLLADVNHRKRVSKFANDTENIRQEKVNKLDYHQNIYEIIMFPTKSIDAVDLKIVTQSDASIQTQFRFKQGLRQRKKIQKTVKFMNQFTIQSQFEMSFSGQSESKRDKAIIKQYQSFNNAQVSSTLLKKRKGIVAWGKTKGMRTLNDIIQQEEAEYYSTKRSYSKSQLNNNKQNIQDLFIGGRSSSRSLIDRIEVRDKVKTKIPQLQNLDFTEGDLNNLFVDVDKARDFQFLNYNMTEYKSKFETIDVLKSQKFLTPKSADKQNKYRGYHSQYQSPGNSSSAPTYTNYLLTLKYIEFIVQTVYRHLNNIKHDNVEKYERLRNFIRFPHSSIYRCNEPKWIELSKEELEMGINELRKIFGRIERIHGGCKKRQGKVCSHILSFLAKMGINILLDD